MRKFTPFLFILVLLVSCSSVSVRNQTYTIYALSLERDVSTTKHGNLRTDTDADTFLEESGFDYGDIINVSFLDRNVEMPIVPVFSSAASGQAALALRKTDVSKEYDCLATFFINFGDFLTTYGIATKSVHEDGTWDWVAEPGVTFPLRFDITMVEKAGYRTEVELSMLERTNAREDYPDLTDWQFANFRKVTTTGMGNNLYRSSTPIDGELGRDIFAMKAFEEASVSVIINIADNTWNDIPESYYKHQKILLLPMSVDITSESNLEYVVQSLQFMAANPGIYCVHCKEGKDRTGFIIAILELLMGADMDEVIEDYMVTYENFYSVKKGTEKYRYISQTLIQQLETCGIKGTEHLKEQTEEFLEKHGLTGEELTILRQNLGV